MEIKLRIQIIDKIKRGYRDPMMMSIYFNARILIYHSAMSE